MALKFKNAENLSWDVYLFSGTATQEKSTINQVAENRNLFCHSFGGKHLKLRCWKGHALSVGSRKGPVLASPQLLVVARHAGHSSPCRCITQSLSLCSKGGLLFCFLSLLSHGNPLSVSSRSKVASSNKISVIGLRATLIW